MIFTVKPDCCRICFSTENKLKSLFNSFHDQMNYSSIYEYCTSYNGAFYETISGILPVNICIDCEEELIKFYYFKKKCEISENVLEYANSLKTNLGENEKLKSLSINLFTAEDELVFSIDGFTISTDDFSEYEPIAEIFTQNNIAQNNDERSEQNTNTELSNLDDLTVSNVNTEILGETSDLDQMAIELTATDSGSDSISNIFMETPANRSVASQKSKNSTNTETRTKKRKPLQLCPICGKLITYKGMHNHMLSHKTLKPEEYKYFCNVCNKRFKYAGALSSHKRLHTNDMRYECEYCKKKFMIWATRRRHIEKEHTGIRRYDCQICGAKFLDRGTRTNHVRQHLGELPFECDLCHKKFIDKQALTLHTVTHTKNGKHACDICNKRFARSSALKTHRAIHTGEKKFKCEFCDKRYSENFLIRNHVLKSHPGCELPPLLRDIKNRMVITKS